MTPQTFGPAWAGQSISCTITSGSATLTYTTGANRCVRLYNQGPSTVFVRATVGAGTAVTSDLPIPSGGVETFTIGSADTISAVTASSTAVLYINQGEGM